MAPSEGSGTVGSRPGSISKPIVLKAYLASALTGLGGSREEVLLLQDRIESICSAHGVDVYRPVKATDPEHHPDVGAETVYSVDRREVLSRDLLILMTHVPSFGSGQEAQLASAALIPILLIRPVDKKISRMLLGIPTLKYEVEADEQTLEARLGEALDVLRPIIAGRREFVSGTNKVAIGARLRELREERGLSRDEVATQLGLSVEEVRCVEEDATSTSNPSFIVLRRIAEVLGVTLAEVCDPMYVDAATSEIVKELLHGVPLSNLEYRDSKRGQFWRTVAPQDVPRVIRRILNHILERDLQ